MPNDLSEADLASLTARAISQPLVTDMYTADPSAHVFDGAIYLYPSHDIEGGVPFNDNGDHFCMEDYHVFRMDSPEDGRAVDCGVALHVDDVPWAQRQMWAPDAACRDGKYYLYFPAKSSDGRFRIGVAVADRPQGPFRAEPHAIEGSYSIDPAVYADDGAFYLYFGGLWGGQLQKYRDNTYAETNEEPASDAPALGPRVARLDADMKRLAEAPREVLILDATGQPLRAGDHERRYFEAPWMHKYQGTYYFSYSTGDTHLLCYATGANPYGPFTYQGRILTEVVGWTTHHSIVQFAGQWYLFYHDALLSGGVTHLRSMKMAPLHHDDQGRITVLHPYGQ